MPQAEFTGWMEFPYGILSAALTYDAPTLRQMREVVERDLRDPGGRTITSEEVTGLIAAGLAEVGAIYPRQVIDVITLAADTWRYATMAEDPFRVEVVTHGGVARQVEPGDGEGRDGGWDYYAGIVHLPSTTDFTIAAAPADSDTLRVWGYAGRFLPTSDDDLCDVDAVANEAVRQYAVLQGYQRLVNDRSLFTQWSTASGNTDVTMSQLIGLSQVFSQQWSATRKRLKLLRRS